MVCQRRAGSASWPAAGRLPAEFTGPLWCRRGVKTTPIAVPNAAGESGWGLTRVIRGLRFSEAGAKIAFGILIRPGTYTRRRCSDAGGKSPDVYRCAGHCRSLPATDTLRDGSQAFQHAVVEFYFSRNALHTHCTSERRPGDAGARLRRNRRGADCGRSDLHFSEGRVTDNGEINAFRGGIKRIIERTPVPPQEVTPENLQAQVLALRGDAR